MRHHYILKYLGRVKMEEKSLNEVIVHSGLIMFKRQEIGETLFNSLTIHTKTAFSSL